MPFLLFLKKRQNLQLSSAANYRKRLKGVNDDNCFCAKYPSVAICVRSKARADKTTGMIWTKTIRNYDGSLLMKSFIITFNMCLINSAAYIQITQHPNRSGAK